MKRPFLQKQHLAKASKDVISLLRDKLEEGQQVLDTFQAENNDYQTMLGKQKKEISVGMMRLAQQQNLENLK